MIRAIKVITTLMILSIGIISSCGDGDDSLDTTFGIFEIIDSNTVQMDGDITSSTLDDFNEMIDSYEDIDRIIMVEVPGSADDEINLLVSRRVHSLGFATHLKENGIIASGGVDFFLAGTSRTMGDNAMIGVHSWSNGINEATDYPRGDANHQPYIDYYTSIGFTTREAEEFYYFTINAAPASSIHYMTTDEIEEYKILKP